MSGPAGRVIRGAGKDTAGFGGGGTAPPADMLPLLRLRAQPPPPPASRLRLPGLAAAAAAADPVRGVRACHSRRGRGHGPSAGRAPPCHVGTGERASSLVPARVTRTGAVRCAPASKPTPQLSRALRITCRPCAKGVPPAHPTPLSQPVLAHCPHLGRNRSCDSEGKLQAHLESGVRLLKGTLMGF